MKKQNTNLEEYSFLVKYNQEKERIFVNIIRKIELKNKTKLKLIEIESN